MTTTEAAELLGISADTLGVQIRRGRLKARKVGRDWHVTPSEVERYRRELLGKRRRKVTSVSAVLAKSPDVSAATDGRIYDGPPPPRFCPAPKPSQRKRRPKVSAE